MTSSGQGNPSNKTKDTSSTSSGPVRATSSTKTVLLQVHVQANDIRYAYEVACEICNKTLCLASWEIKITS